MPPSTRVICTGPTGGIPLVEKHGFFPKPQLTARAYLLAASSTCLNSTLRKLHFGTARDIFATKALLGCAGTLTPYGCNENVQGAFFNPWQTMKILPLAHIA